MRNGDVRRGDRYELLYALCLKLSLNGEEFRSGEVLLNDDDDMLKSLLGEIERYPDRLDCNGEILSANSL